MPRSSRSSARPSPSSRMPTGSRSASTQAYQPPQQHHAPPPAPHQAPPPMAQPSMGGGGGLFANMASTAAGVAVGSTVGHGLSNMLFGGSSSEPAPQPQQQQQQPQPWAQGYNAQDAAKGAACEAQSKDLLRCFEATNNDTSACSYYLEQLKACSAAAQSFA